MPQAFFPRLGEENALPPIGNITVKRLEIPPKRLAYDMRDVGSPIQERRLSLDEFQI
jgi:hypothetical protein